MNEIVRESVDEAFDKRDNPIHPANHLGFILARNLRRIYPKDTDLETFEPLLQEYKEGLNEVGITESREYGVFDIYEIADQLEDAWPKVEQASDKVRKATRGYKKWLEFPTVKQIKNPKTKILLAALYEMQQLAGNKSFFISQQQAGEIIGIGQAAAGMKMNKLVRDGEIMLLKKGRTGFATSYLVEKHPAVQKGKVSM